MEPDGIILIDKPKGITSHDAVNRMRRLLRTKKIGHTGTLDPDATGLLVVLAGRAAKAAEYITSDEKVYEATLRLGISTDTQDISGEIISESDIIPDSEKVLAAVRSFEGGYMQIPPMYSAIKQNGRKLVDLARRGIEIEREPRKVEITDIKAEKINESNYSLYVKCSKGTYIRTLCDDIGKKLGCGGCMASLRRIKSGDFDIKDAVTLPECDNMTYDRLCNRLMATESLFSSLPVLKLDGFFLKLCKSGCEIYQKKINTSYDLGQRVRLYDEEGFFALGEVRDYEDGSAVKSIKVFRL
ncbi:MAG: tRNA pseudouridine(55) synthase TruB [Clostridia bacterium]|nr:tRNA pseudouridine(55) synthase TruB [Clostridia bacterium]